MRGLGDDRDFDARTILTDARVYFILTAASDGDQSRCIAMKSQVVDPRLVVPDLSIPFEPSPDSLIGCRHTEAGAHSAILGIDRARARAEGLVSS